MTASTSAIARSAAPATLRPLAQQAVELPERLAPLRLGFGADQIGKPSTPVRSSLPFAKRAG